MRYYGTVPALAWAIAHYFYNHKHHTNVAGEYYPYRLSNPKSSNPHQIYQDYYQPWRDRDDYDKFITQVRQNIRVGVIKKEIETVIDLTVAERLRRVCEAVDIVFFYPIVYRLDTKKCALDSSRLRIPESAVANSSEYIISDLDESEIDEILFLDYEADEDFKRLITEEYSFFKREKLRQFDSETALTILERRCSSIGVQQPASRP